MVFFSLAAIVVAVAAFEVVVGVVLPKLGNIGELTPMREFVRPLWMGARPFELDGCRLGMDSGMLMLMGNPILLLAFADVMPMGKPMLLVPFPDDMPNA